MKETLTDQCFSELLNSILTGKYAPGQHLTLMELKTHLKVGMSPLREALSRLHASGFVALENNKGFKVSPLTETIIIDLVHSFAEIDSLALELSIEHGDLEWESELLEVLQQLKEWEHVSSINLSDWMAKNNAFHRALISACPYSHLLEVREKLYQRFEWFIHLAYLQKKTSLEVNHSEHLRIAELAISRDSAKAGLLLKYHITNSLDEIIENLKKDGIL